MINLAFILRVLKGPSYSNQLSFGAKSKTDISLSLFALALHNKFAITLMCVLTFEIIQIHLCKNLVKFGPVSPEITQVALLWQRDRATRLSVEILQLQNIPFEN